jgi:chromosome segregation ATPase
VENSVSLQIDSNYQVIRHLEDEVDRVRAEKELLREKLNYCEKDITSLKRGIYKTETRNAFLNQEVMRYQQLVEQLQKTLQAKEHRISQIQNEANFSDWRRREEPAGDAFTLAHRLKRMFTANT